MDPDQIMLTIQSSDPKISLLLRNWCELQDRYSKITGEPAYDNSELANTSLFVSAANSLENWTGLSEHWIARSAMPPVGNLRARPTRRGLLDAYLEDSKSDRGYCFEFKQGWLKENATKNGFRYWGANPFTAASKQLDCLNYQGSFLLEDGNFSFTGAYLVPEMDPSNGKTKCSRKNAFEKLIEFCSDKDYDHFAVYSPNLERVALTRGRAGAKTYRPAVAIALNAHQFKNN